MISLSAVYSQTPFHLKVIRKVKVEFTLEQTTKAQKGYSSTLSLTSALDGVGGQRTPRPLYPQERPGTHSIGGWVGRRAGLEGCGKSRPHRHPIPGPSSPSRSLYRLSYPGPQR